MFMLIQTKIILTTEEPQQIFIIGAVHAVHNFIAVNANIEVRKDDMSEMDVHIILTSAIQCSVKDLVYTCNKN